MLHLELFREIYMYMYFVNKSNMRFEPFLSWCNSIWGRTKLKYVKFKPHCFFQNSNYDTKCNTLILSQAWCLNSSEAF